MSKVVIITASYNKGKYVKNTIQGVIDQTYKDWEYFLVDNSTDDITRPIIREALKIHNNKQIHYIEKDYTEAERQEFYIPAVILNEYMAKADPEDYILFIADDDYIEPTCLEKLAGLLNSNQDINVVYGRMNGYVLEGDTFVPWRVLQANRVWEKGSVLDCILDGGQMIFRKKCLDVLSKPWYNELNNADASHCDGLFMNKLCDAFPFYPVDEPLMVKRRTELSVHTRA